MKNSFKISHKIIAVICSVVILLSAISSIAFNIFALSDADVWDGTIATEYAGGSGTVEDPYLISTPEQLALLVTTSGANTSGKYYSLTADMYLNDTTNPDWKNNSPKNWCAPEKDNFFRGNFDGNGHTVKGLYYNGSKQDAALFAGIRGTGVSIKNLAIADSSLATTANYAAAFAGQAFNSSVTVFENCYVYDTVTVTANNSAAGFIGGGTCASILFENCASFANVTTAITSGNRYGSFVGGLVYNNGTGDARKITYNSCIGNIAYTNYAQYPTYTASYCAVNGTAHSGSNKTYPTVVSLSNMKGELAKTNMPALDWNTFKTANQYPILKFCTDENIGNGEDDDDQGNGGNNDNNGEDVVYSFENWSGGTYDKSLTGISFADVAKYGKKSLKYRLPESTANYGTPRLAVLTDGWSTAKVEEGSLYELSFWYKVDGTPTHKGQFVVYTTKTGGTTDTANRQSQILDKKVIFNSDTTGSGENGWVKATVKFIADLKGEEYNLVSIGVMGIGEASVDKDIYIDAVTLQKVEPDGEEDTVYSFENWSAGTHDKSATGISFSDVAKDGTKSLKYRLDAGTGNYAIARVALLNEGLSTAKAVLGTTYEMSFWYKVDGTPTNKGEFVVYTANSGGATSDAYRQVQTLNKKVIFDSDTTDSGENGWIKETVTFTADMNEDGRDFIVIGIKGIGSAAVDKDIYIDEVTIKTLHVSKICKITAHYNDAENTVKVINAVVGKPVSIPPVDRPGYYIQSWYTDKDLTNKFDPSKISEGKMDIYAKWAVMDGEVVCDFDSYPFIPGKGMNAACYTIANDIGVDNTKALKYATSALYTNWWNTRLAGIAIGGSSYYLNEKSLYKVSFKYFVPSKPDATINVNIWAANKENIGDTTNALQQNVSETLIINDKTPTGEWLTYTASFTAELYDPTIDNSTTNDTLTGLNLLALGVVTGEKLSTNAIVYFDNFKVENIKAEAQTTITAHTKGSSKTQVFNGVPGHTLVEPPVREDYIFDGWYSDPALKNAVKVVKFPESGNLDLYVKWKSFKNGDSITIGFDDYSYVSGSKQFYPWYSLDNTDSADGDGVSVKATMDSSCSTTMRLSYKGYPVLIEDGSRYLVSFSYKNIDEVPNKWTTRVYATSSLNCGIGTTQQSSEDDAYRLTLSRAAGFGTWKRHTYSFTASLKYPGHNALAINMQTNSFSEVKEIRALIDNVTIKRIADDDVVCMTNTLTGPDYVIGKKDEKITLPNDLKLDGYKFLGWFMDKNYGLEVADALFSEDTVFYAKWARVKFAQDFEEYDYQGYGIGYDLDVEYYNNKVSGYNSKNVYSGSSSIHRIGKVSSDKKFTLITDANDKIAIGETYKVTYYVKLLSTKNEDQNIYVLPTDSYFYPGACDTDMAIPSVSLNELYPGVWYKITNIVTLYSPYLAVKTPGLSDIYFDNFTMELVNSDTIIDESEKVIPLGKVPARIEENEEFEDMEFEDIPLDDPIIEDDVDENVDSNDEKAPQNNEVSNNDSNEKSSNNTVVILVISILAAVLVVATVLVVIYLKKRKLK